MGISLSVSSNVAVPVATSVSFDQPGIVTDGLFAILNPDADGALTTAWTDSGNTVASGTIGTNAINTNFGAQTRNPVGAAIRIDGDFYKVTGAGTFDITVTPNLVKTYTNGEIIYVDRISALADESGNTTGAAQGTANNQPLRFPDCLNGKTCVGGSIQNGNPFMTLDSAFHALPAGANTFMGIVKSVDSALRVISEMSEGGTFRWRSVYNAGGGSLSFINRNGTGGGVAMTGVTKTSWNILIGTFDGNTTVGVGANSSTLTTNASNGGVENGCDAASIYATVTGGNNIFVTGSDLRGAGIFLYYNKKLSPAEIDQNIAYLQAYYGVTFPQA